MGNPQKIKFRDVADFLSYLPAEELQLVQALRNIVLDCLYDTGEEKLSFNVPFYHRYGQLCFIWPASVPWGNLKTGVALGFIQGRSLSDPEQLLQFQERKQVGRVIFTHPGQLQREQIEALIYEAMALNEERRKG